MKDNKYKVWFANCNYKDQFEIVFAINQNDALIIAQAERIKQGCDYTLDRIEVYIKK